jgi:hypothetical protein
MKTIIKILLTAIVLFIFSASAIAQVSDGAYAEAHIITPLTINKTVDMDFGNIAVINSPGHVYLSTTGGRTSDGGATPVANPAGIVTAAEFEITGLGNAQVVITIQGVPPEDATIDVVHTNTVDLMPVSNFVCDPPSGFLIPAGGLETIYVGATLTTAADQLPGTYHTISDFVVEINYQ